MRSTKTIVYPAPGQPDISKRVTRAVRRLCQSQATVPGPNGSRVSLSRQVVDELVGRMIHATSHAAIRPIDNRLRRRGAPPDNARIILASDVLEACAELGISTGLRYVPPESFAVALFNVVSPIIWGSGGHNPRKTFERLRKAQIIRN